ncbi:MULTISPECIES: S1 RNA-binding domain-containing protein [Clostridiaceae]|uniref:30S ribosomal protein S1 n=1 Tax=Clostridium facile TaxID=2763035 RepID=A0ABR7IRQ8_9CLOT|nr:MULTISPECIES: S1 RNA-binding domain-containing protein [Clostridiaceae]MBC5787825.1 30S ribosomal protein S1 [Clostridium facile]PWN00455.1 MAG: 30S ribosomal protein S1 [Massilioclostridium sp.]
MRFYPEGLLYHQPENKLGISTPFQLKESMASQKILESKAILCDSQHNLVVQLGCMKGFIPREEGAIGIGEGTTKDIALISKVNKPVCFVVTGFQEQNGETIALLSRRKAQQICYREYINQLAPGDIIPAVVTHLEPFGCFVDIGCGIPSLIPIDAISVSRISHPKDRFWVGQEIRTIVRSLDENGRVFLSHKELLGTWEQNVSQFHAGETVGGIVRSIESYGIFVELTPNLAGLAEYKEGVQAGQNASIYIKSLIPEKMKIKLIIVDAFDAPPTKPEVQYFIDEGHIDHWCYSPDCCSRMIETNFQFPLEE